MAAIYLEKPPENIYKYLLRIQGEIKSSKGVANFSLPETVYQIIREHEARNKKTTTFELLNTNYLIENGWVKDGSKSYMKGKNAITYTGTNWLFNNELLTEENFEEKINTKTPDV